MVLRGVILYCRRRLLHSSVMGSQRNKGSGIAIVLGARVVTMWWQMRISKFHSVMAGKNLISVLPRDMVSSAHYSNAGEGNYW